MLGFGLKVNSLFCGLHHGPFNKFQSRENSVVATGLCLATKENFISKLSEFVSYYIFISIKSPESGGKNMVIILVVSKNLHVLSHGPV